MGMQNPGNVGSSVEGWGEGLNSSFKVVTAQITYNNKEDFELKYPDTANINIGSMVQPLNYEDACFCNVA